METKTKSKIMIDENKIWEMVDDVFDANNYIHDFSEMSDYDWETPLWDEEQMKDAIEKGIRCGIQEFIKSLWHDASEEPEDATHILVISDEGNFPIFHNAGVDWQLYAKRNAIERWCYLSDLLPKEGGEK